MQPANPKTRLSKLACCEQDAMLFRNKHIQLAGLLNRPVASPAARLALERAEIFGNGD
jgi:hypothetical protein